jgi:hypothetical protein
MTKCNLCGEEWPRDPALEVACPKCRAAVGVGCKDERPSGHRVNRFDVHPERDQCALDKGLIGLCPKRKFGP